MSTATSLYGASSNVPPITIEENSILLKTISCVPLVGT
jgi:hypothetical protein